MEEGGLTQKAQRWNRLKVAGLATRARPAYKQPFQRLRIVTANVCRR
jgi:hypothetical protein